METKDPEKLTGFSAEDLSIINKMSAVDMGRLMVQVRQELDAATDVKSRFEKQYDTIKRALPKKMEEAGLEKFTVDGRPITTRIEIYTSIPADHREEAYAWLRKHGLGEIITNTVNGSTLRATVKEQLHNGQHFPEDLFKITMEPQARFY